MARAGRPAYLQARDGRVDDVGPYRAGRPASCTDPFYFPARPAVLGSALPCDRAAAEYDVAARRISLGRRRRLVLFCRSKDDNVRLFMVQAPEQGGDSTGLEDADL